jgi:hypothetical protein
MTAAATRYRRWFEEVVSGGDLSLADELLTPGYDAFGLLQQLGVGPGYRPHWGIP